MNYKNGEKYEGMMINKIKEGKGEMSYKNWDKYHMLVNLKEIKEMGKE